MKIDSLVLFDVIMPDGNPAGMMVKFEDDAGDLSLQQVMDMIQRTANNMMDGVTFDSATVVDLHDEKIPNAFKPKNALGGHMGEDMSLPHPENPNQKVWLEHVMTINGLPEESKGDSEEE